MNTFSGFNDQDKKEIMSVELMVHVLTFQDVFNFPNAESPGGRFFGLVNIANGEMAFICAIF
ncbi:MAG: hypothetical protein R2778_13520 [Saprospiraceae bacterium]